MIKKTLTVLAVSLLTTSAFAQFSMSAQYSRISFLAGSEVKNSGFGLVGNYGLDNGLIAYGGFGIYSAYELEGTFTATANNNQTSPSSIEVKYTNSIPLTNVFVGVKKYFVGEYDDEGFGIYGMGELGFMASSYSTDVEDYDEANYNLTVAEDETISNFMFGLGVGLEQGFEFGSIFLEAKLNITSNEENGEAVEVEIPASTVLNFGFRRMF